MVSIRPKRVLMQLSAAGSTLMARRPIERTAFRTKSMSTSDAYLHQKSDDRGRLNGVEHVTDS